MSPFTHLFLSWLVADSFPSLSPRERFLVTLSGVVPDLDGAGAIVELATRDGDHPLLWFSEYHHLLHGAPFALAVAAGAALLARKKLAVGLLSLLTFHLHLLCDILGARGPDGIQWPIPYLSPFRPGPLLSWDHQWALNAWPNFLITGVAIFVLFWRARLKGYSILSLFSESADRAFVAAIRRRFPLAS